MELKTFVVAILCFFLLVVGFLESEEQDIQSLIKDLGNSDEKVSKNAINTLTRIGKPAVPALSEGLRSEDRLVRVNAANALHLISDNTAIPALLEALRDEDGKVRYYVATALVELGKGAEAFPVLIKSLEDEDQEIRFGVASFFGQIVIARDSVYADLMPTGKPDWIAEDYPGELLKQAIPALIKALDDESMKVRIQSGLALAKIDASKTDMVIPVLEKALAVEDREIRGMSVGVLGAIGKPAVPALVKVLNGDNKDDRLIAVYALANIGEAAKDAIPALIKALSDMEPQRNYDDEPFHAAAFALSKIGEPAIPALIQALRDEIGWAGYTLIMIGELAVPALTQALSDKDKDTRAGAASVLEAMFNWDVIEDSELIKQIVPLLGKLLGDENAEVRLNGAKALDEIGEPARGAIPDLIKALNDGDPYVRSAVASALGSIGEPAKAAVPALIKALKDEDESVRGMAALALRDIGPAAKEAVPVLIEVLNDENSGIQDSAAQALGEIRDPAAEPALMQASKSENEFVRNYAIEVLKKLGVSPRGQEQLILKQGKLESRSITTIPPLERIIRIYQDTDGSFLITSVNGIIYRVTREGKIDIVAKGRPLVGVVSVVRDRVSNDLIIVDRDSHAIYRVSQDGQINPILQTAVSTSMEDIIQDSESNDCFVTDDGEKSLYRITGEGKMDIISASLVSVRGVVQDKGAKDLVVCASANLIRIKPDGTSIPIIKEDQPNPLNRPNGLVQDRVSGDFFVVDEANLALYRVTSTGAVTKMSSLPNFPIGITQERETDDFIIIIFPETIMRLSGFSTASESDISDWLDAQAKAVQE